MPDPVAGTIISIGTGGWWVDASGAATGQPSLALSGTTSTTATLILTPPVDAGYHHSDVLYIADGGSTWNTVSAFSGAAITGLTPGTWYTGIAISFNAGGDRSLPSAPPVRFLTKLSDGGTYNLKLGFRTGQAAVDQVSANLDITVRYHRKAFSLRSPTGRIRLSMTEVGQAVILEQLELEATVLGRRKDA